MEAALCNWKTLRLGYSLFSCTFASKTNRFLVGDVKPSHFYRLQNQLLSRHITSEISGNQHNSTVTYLINSCRLSPEGAISAAKWFELKSLEKADSVLAFLRFHGLSETQITKVVRSNVEVLRLDPEKILLPKYEFLRSVGLSREDLAKILAFSPQLLSRSLDRQIIPTYNFLRDLLPEKNVVAVLKRGPRIFVDNLSKNVVPNIGLLRESGMPQPCISLLLAHFTSVLMVNPGKFDQLVGEVKEIGFDLQKSSSVEALCALSGGTKLRVKRGHEVFRRWGWSEADLLSAFIKYPLCMILSEKKLVQSMDFLVNKMGISSRMIAKHPKIFSFSLEKRIIPRFSVVKVLLLKGLMSENFSLGSVVCPVEKLFLERFVDRYLAKVPQLLSVYQGNVDIQDV